MTNLVRYVALLMFSIAPSIFLVGCSSQVTEESAAQTAAENQGDEGPGDDGGVGEE